MNRVTMNLKTRGWRPFACESYERGYAGCWHKSTHASGTADPCDLVTVDREIRGALYRGVQGLGVQLSWFDPRPWTLTQHTDLADALALAQAWKRDVEPSSSSPPPGNWTY